MKKLSLLVALALLITVGGVYATWSYAGTNDIADAYTEAKVIMAGVDLTGANGTYKVESNLVLTVDQANEDHEAKLVFSSNNDQPIFLRVTFTPATNAPETIKLHAVPTELYFTSLMEYKVDSNGNYSAEGTAKPIFAFANPADGHFTENVIWEPDDPDNPTKFTYELDQVDLEDMIYLSQTFKLDVKTEYDAFRAALSGNIIANVTDGTINGSTDQG